MRACDDVTHHMDHSKSLLGITTGGESRETPIVRELCSLRAHIRQSQFLKVNFYLLNCRPYSILPNSIQQES